MSDIQKNLVDWLHSQEEWLQEAASRLANTGEPLTESDIEDITALLKKPEGRAKTNHRTYPQLVHGNAPGAKLRLVSIGPVEGIDRLAPTTPVSFGNKPLCVIYGHNGSGKSGYTRILARASGKPRASELRCNAYGPPPATQNCTITYSVDDVVKSLAWDPKSGPIEDLRCVDIFDTDTAEHYLSEETTASYSPPAVTLLQRLANTCDRIAVRLQTEEKEYHSTLLRIPPDLRNTEIACIYGGLNHETPEADLLRITTWTEQDEEEYAALAATLGTDDPETQANASLDSERFTRALLKTMRDISAALSSEALTDIREARATARTARRTAQQASAALKDSAMIDGVGTDTWKALWQAAREFSLTSYPTSPFPNTDAGARCILCHQGIAIDTAKRLAAFEAFAQGQVSREADVAEQAYQKKLDELPNIQSVENIDERCHAASLPPGSGHRFRPFLEAATATIERLRRHEKEIAATPPILDTELIVELESHARTQAEKASSFAAVSNVEARRAKESTCAELKARRWTAEKRTEIEEHVLKKKAISFLETLKPTVSSRAVSYKAREVANELINASYVNRFNAELLALGAHRIRVELVQKRVEKGTSFLQLRLKDSTSAAGGPDAVLSEGERRVVALAAFLADVTGGPYDTPFVFDDPITSLDQDFELLAIRRLHQLSTTRQVLILTHRLGFVGTITELSRDQITTTEIRGRSGDTGRPALITTYGLKPLAALNTLKQDHLARARKIYAQGEDLYRSTAKELCSDIRIHLERIVESYVICGVVERHRRSVETMKLRYLDRVCAGDREMISRFMTKYSCFEHSQPADSPVSILEPDEIDTDLTELIAWLDPFVKRISK